MSVYYIQQCSSSQNICLKKYYIPFYELGFNILQHLQAIQEMSHSLPETEEEMLKIVGVTKANFEKYGRQLLEITQEAAANKFGIKEL